MVRRGKKEEEREEEGWLGEGRRGLKAIGVDCMEKARMAVVADRVEGRRRSMWLKRELGESLERESDRRGGRG